MTSDLMSAMGGKWTLGLSRQFSYDDAMDYEALLASAGITPLELVGVQLLSVDMIQRLLPIIHDHKAVILRLEGFRVTPSDVQPDMDQIADFSTAMDLPKAERSSASVRWTAEFLRNAADRTLMFDLCVTADD